MKAMLAVLVLVGIAPATGSAQVATAFGQAPPAQHPELFAPDIIADGVHSAPTFSPDGTEMFWSVYYVPRGTESRTQHIFFSRFAGGQWTAPALAPFSGVYSDGGPCLSQDGQRLFFNSNRPADPGGRPADEYVSDLWLVTRTDSGWSVPDRLWFSSDGHDAQPSVAANGNLYFISNRRGCHGVYDIYCAEWLGDRFDTARSLGPTINSAHINFSPWVTPDESCLLFSYANNAPNNGLQVSFRGPDGVWSTPKNLGPVVNSGAAERFPALSRDGKWLFFTRDANRQRRLYWYAADLIGRSHEQR